jgi:RimJ/RimL family protein N-acetyltransferase
LNAATQLSGGEKMGNAEPTVYVRENVHGSELILRDMIAEDVDEVVRYWLTRTDEDLRVLGVERSVLGTEPELRERFLKLTCGARQSEEDRRGYVYTIDGQIIGYSNTKLVSSGVAYHHNHIIKGDARGRGLASLIFVRLVRTTMHKLGLNKLIMQARPGNPAVNKLLQHTVKLTPVRQHIAEPDGGIASPGEFNCYELELAHFDTVEDPMDQVQTGVA